MHLSGARNDTSLLSLRGAEGDEAISVGKGIATPRQVGSRNDKVVARFILALWGDESCPYGISILKEGTPSCLRILKHK